jgi:hypothetical protein
MSVRTATGLAWSSWMLVVVLTASSLLLLSRNLSHPDAHVFDWWLGNALVVIDATVGAVVASRRPENAVGWLLCLSGVAVSSSSFASQYAIYALLARPGSLPAGEALAWVASWLLPIMIGSQLFYLLLFPTGRLPGRRWRWLARLAAAFIVVGAVLAALSPGAYLGALGPIRNPIGIEGFTGVYKAVLYVMAPLLYTAVTASLILRLRRAGGVERQQIKWLAYGAAAFAAGIVLLIIPLATETPRWLEWGGEAVFTLAGAAVPISMGVAILRYRLYDIDLVINRTLVYAVLTASLVLVYVASVAGLQRMFSPLAGEGNQLSVVASTLLIAALFGPLRRRVQGLIDRRFYRKKYDSAKTLEDFGVRLREETNLGALSEDLVGVVQGTLQPAHASLWLRPPAGPRDASEDTLR